jgi:predicted RecB family nuclease
MSWSTQSDFKIQLQRLWDRGEILAELWGETTRFPLRLTCRIPNSNEISENFEGVRKWITELKALKNCRISMREFNHKSFGRNSIPDEVWIDTVDDALIWINKRKDYAIFDSLIKLTRQEEPELLQFLRAEPFKALAASNDWTKFLAVVAWMKKNPRPGIFIREVVIQGIHSKFIQENAKLISELLDVTLPSDAINESMTGIKKFAPRYGFCEERPQIRFRILDKRHNLFPMTNDQDISLDWETFSELKTDIRRVFITENKTNFLAFPETPDSMVIFGSGYGFEHLGAASWLFYCNLYYWGDIDSHGFGALNNARNYFPHIQALMMNEKTLLLYKHLKGNEVTAHEADWLENLTTEEQDIFQGLRTNRWGEQFRLEQEHIDWDFAKSSITAAISNECLSQRTSLEPLLINNRDVIIQLTPEPCDLRLFLSTREKFSDDASPYTELLKSFRDRALSRQREQAGEFTDLLESKDDEARIRSTIDAITSGIPVICNPLLHMQCRIAGVPVVVRSEIDFLVMQEGQYVVRQISPKQAIVQESESNLASFTQVRLFSWLLRNSLGVVPLRMEIISAKNEVIQVMPDDASVLRILHKALSAKYASNELYVPVGWSKCSGCGFNTRCWNKARSSNDIAQLPGLDQNLARTLKHEGIEDIATLLATFDEQSLSARSRRVSGRSLRVGKQAREILAHAHAFERQEPFWLQQPVLPSSANYAILDFEGAPPHGDKPEILFLFGLKVFGTKPSAYDYSEGGYGLENESHAWGEFLKNTKTIFSTHGDDIPFIHWGHYERTMLKKYVDKLGDEDGIASKLLNNLIDLSILLQGSVALPIPSYSLKVVEK